MKFRNQRHKELFNEAIRRLDKQNNTLMAVVYLFTAHNRLWSMTRHGICYSGVDFNHIRLRNCSVGMYTLIQFQYSIVGALLPIATYIPLFIWRLRIKGVPKSSQPTKKPSM